MVKIILKRTAFGYKVVVEDNSYSYIKKSSKIRDKYGIYPKQLIGYIIKKTYRNYNDNYIFALDLNQLYLWLLLGGSFSRSIHKFNFFFKESVISGRIV